MPADLKWISGFGRCPFVFNATLSHVQVRRAMTLPHREKAYLRYVSSPNRQVQPYDTSLENSGDPSSTFHTHSSKDDWRSTADAPQQLPHQSHLSDDIWAPMSASHSVAGMDLPEITTQQTDTQNTSSIAITISGQLRVSSPAHFQLWCWWWLGLWTINIQTSFKIIHTRSRGSPPIA